MIGAFLVVVTAATFVKGRVFCVGECPTARAALLVAGVAAFAGETGSCSTVAEVISFAVVVITSVGADGETFKVPVKDCKLQKTPSSLELKETCPASVKDEGVKQKSTPPNVSVNAVCSIGTETAVGMVKQRKYKPCWLVHKC